LDAASTTHNEYMSSVVDAVLARQGNDRRSVKMTITQANIQNTPLAAFVGDEPDPKPLGEIPEDAGAKAEREIMFRKRQKRREAKRRLRQIEAQSQEAPSNYQAEFRGRTPRDPGRPPALLRSLAGRRVTRRD
jgi:hypothetical protein